MYSQGGVVKIVHLSDLHAGASANTVKIHKKFFADHAQEINDSDVMVLAGDSISTSQHQFKTLFRTIRELCPDIVILCVNGNHDYWGQAKNPRWTPTLEDILEEQEGYFQEFKIHHLQRHGSVDFPNHGIKFWGFDGWYHHANPETNDSKWMRTCWQTEYGGVRPFDYLTKKAYETFDQILVDSADYQGKKVMVTHMPPMSMAPPDETWSFYGTTYSAQETQYMHRGIRSMLEPIAENFDWCLMGHFHSFYDLIIERCRFRTTGCNYDKPVMNTIDIY